MKMSHTVKESQIEHQLRNWLSDARRVVIAGIGNPLRRDDLVGLRIAGSLRNRVSRSVHLIECETVPESFIGPIIDLTPTHVLLIDAADLSLKPGSSKLIRPDQLLQQPAISTHALPLKIFCEYLGRETGAKIALLLIQPKDTSFGEGLTKEVETAAGELTDFLSKILP